MSKLSVAVRGAINVFIVLLVSHTAAAASGPAAVEQTKGLAKSRHDFGISVVAGYIDYKEPGIMREYGSLFGLNGTWSHTFLSGVVLSAEVEELYGRLLYDGGSQDGSGNITRFTQPTTDYIFNSRAFIGYRGQLMAPWTITPFVGLGYRNLNDKIDGAGSYNRNVSYIYVPVGATLEGALSKKWKLVFAGDLDWMPYGTVVSALSEASSFPDLTNHNRGLGGRLGTSVIYDRGDLALRVGLLYQKWKIQESDHVLVKSGTKTYDFAEPDNESDFIGINAGVDF